MPRPHPPTRPRPHPHPHTLPLTLTLALTACTSSSTASDLTRVRQLSAAPALPELDSGDDRAHADRDALELLRRPLDADTAVRVALLHNRALRARLRELGIARGRLMQAEAVANPTASAEAIVEEPVELELRVDYDISSLLLAPLRADAAEAALEAERYRAAAAVLQLGYEVRSALHALQASERRVEIGRTALEAYRLGHETIDALHAAGNVRELDAASHAAAYERARVRFDELVIERIERRERLHRLLGIDPEQTTLHVQLGPPEVPAELPVPSHAEQRARDASLALGETRMRAAAAGLHARASSTEGWLPEIEVGVLSRYEQRTAEADFGDDEAWRWGGGVTVTVPLFDRARGTARAIEAEQAQLEDRHAAALTDLRSHVIESEERLAHAHRRAQQFKTAILPAHARLLEQTLLQYNAMQASVFDLLQARREQLEVELAYVEAVREYWAAADAFDALLAGLQVDPVASAVGAPVGSERMERLESGGH